MTTSTAPAYVPSLPYVRLNLRRNPFGALRPAERRDVAVDDAEAPAAALAGSLIAGAEGRRPPFALQLVGPPGCGKTTRLEILRAHLPDAPAMGWSATTGWPAVPAGAPLFVDDAHAMPWRVRRLVRRRPALALATHRDLARPLRRWGFEVRTVDVPSRLGHGSLRRIVDRRLARARRAPGPVPHIGEDVLERLVRRHGPDLRAILAELYDRVQGMAAEPLGPRGIVRREEEPG